ncbi:CAP domain-containing protein [Geodermatophilus sp. SYSU D00965]
MGRLFRRVLPVLAVVAVVAGVALAVPMVSRVVTTASDQVALDGSSSSYGTTTSDDPTSSDDAISGGATVQMGVDGDPAAPPPSTPAESPAAASTTPATEEPAAEADAPDATADEPAASSPDEPAEEAADEPTAAEEAADEPAAAERTAAPAAAAPADPSTEGQVLALVNEARAGAGCAPLVADAALAAVARGHSADMRDRDYFAHDTPEGLSPFDRAEQAGVGYARAENIAFGQPDAAAVMEAWMDSAGHRANILDCDLTKLGVGVAEGPGGPWWTQLFGA